MRTMDTACRIVPLATRHVAGFRAALDAVAQERRYLAMLEAPPIARVRRFVLDSLREGATHFVALDGDAVVGWCDVRPRPQPTMRHCGVLGMGVIDGYRRQGLGGRLLAMTLDGAFAGSVRRVELTVRTDNHAAISLYRRHGFETEGTCRQALLVDGACHDLLLMARLA